MLPLPDFLFIGICEKLIFLQDFSKDLVFRDYLQDGAKLLMHGPANINSLSIVSNANTIFFFNDDGSSIRYSFQEEKEILKVLRLGDRCIYVFKTGEIKFLDWSNIIRKDEALAFTTEQTNFGTIVDATAFPPNKIIAIPKSSNLPREHSLLSSSTLSKELSFIDTSVKIESVAVEGNTRSLIYGCGPVASKKLFTVDLTNKGGELLLNQLSQEVDFRPLLSFDNNNRFLLLGANSARDCLLLDLQLSTTELQLDSLGGPCQPVDFSDKYITRKKKLYVY